MSENHDSLGASVAYSELVAIDQKDIILMIDFDSAVSICSACIANKSANPVDVLTLWFTKLLGAYIDDSGYCVLAAREMCKWFTIVGNSYTMRFSLLTLNSSSGSRNWQWSPQRSYKTHVCGTRICIHIQGSIAGSRRTFGSNPCLSCLYNYRLLFNVVRGAWIKPICKIFLYIFAYIIQR